MSYPNASIVLHHYWGPVTATLDWCEANYQFSRYIAEAANSFSNVVTVAFALYGAAQALVEGLPRRYLAGYAGFALVGLGSFIFHATLLFEAQLADELPMIYVASYCSAILFDTAQGYELHGPGSRAVPLSIGVIVFDVLFTWSYYLYRDPVYHQIVFASLLIGITIRTIVLLRDREIAQRVPDHVKAHVSRMFTFGVATFAFGFFVWNLDNVFCSTVTKWKHGLGWPAAFLLEGHSWWHVFTAAGTYLMLIGNTYFTLCIKDDYRNYEVKYVAGLPTIHRTGKTKVQ